MDTMQQILGELETLGIDVTNEGDLDVEAISTPTMGSDEVGVDFGNYLNILSELAPAVIKAGGDISKEAGKGGEANKAIAADVRLADAKTDLGIAQKGKDKNKIAAAEAAVTAAQSAASAASTGLSDGAANKRRDAAQAQLTKAADGLKKKPNDKWWQARVPAWQSVLDNLPAGGVPAPTDSTPWTSPPKSSALDFLKQDVGPLPLYYWLLGAGAAVGGYVFWKKHKAKVA